MAEQLNFEEVFQAGAQTSLRLLAQYVHEQTPPDVSMTEEQREGYMAARQGFLIMITDAQKAIAITGDTTT